MKAKHTIPFIVYKCFGIIAIVLLISCEKFLDFRPDKKMVIANSLADLQAVFDHAGIMRSNANIVELYADNHSYLEVDFEAMDDVLRLDLTWQTPNINHSWGWNTYYRNIFYANEILAGLNKITVLEREKEQEKHLKGSALFARAIYYYHLVQIYGVPYSSEKANIEKGLPLRLSPDFNQKVGRSSLQATYQQIVDDLSKAKELLPETRTEIPTRPWIASSYAALANVYLTMQDFERAYLFADSTLQYVSELMDFNNLDKNTITPFEPFNREVLYFSNFGQVGVLSNRILNVNMDLYQSYSEKDLRRSIYFLPRDNGTIQYKGDYAFPNESFFNGLTVAEMYLVRAECYARKGDFAKAKADMESLLKSRWKDNGYQFPADINDSNILDYILEERRKELVFKGRRWYDIRRLAQEGLLKEKIERRVGETVYSIDPTDRNYNTFRIHDEAVRLGGYDQ